MLEIANLEVVYNEVALVLRGLSLEVRDGQIVASKEVEGWEPQGNPLDGEEVELYRDGDGDGEFEYDHQNIANGSLYRKEATTITYNDIYVGCITYTRECEKVV